MRNILKDIAEFLAKCILIGAVAGVTVFGTIIGGAYLIDHSDYCKSWLHHGGINDCLMRVPEGKALIIDGGNFSVGIYEDGRIPREDPPFGLAFFPGPGIYRVEIGSGTEFYIVPLTWVQYLPLGVTPMPDPNNNNIVQLHH